MSGDFSPEQVQAVSRAISNTMDDLPNPNPNPTLTLTLTLTQP